MEDTTSIALTIGTLLDEDFGRAIEGIEISVGQILAIISAARALAD